jgi:hypothetical protein
MTVAINSAVFSSAVPATVYVDGQTGLDTNDGATPATALKTLTEAELRTAALCFDTDIQIVVLTTGTYACPSFRPRLFRAGQLYVRAVPQTTILASTAALVGSTVTTIKSSGLVVDQFIDFWIHVLTGAAAGDYRLIKDNSATDITPVRNFSAAVAQGDLYEIVDAVTVLDGSIFPVLYGTPTSLGSAFTFAPTLNFENFVVDKAVVCDGRVAWWRCKSTTTGLILATNGAATQILLGVDGSISPAGVFAFGGYGPQRVYNGGSKAYLGAGLAYYSREEPDAGGFFGYVNATDGLYLRNHPYTQLLGGRSRDDHVTVEGAGARLVVGGDPFGSYQMENGQQTGILRVWRGAACTFSKGTLVGTGVNGIGVTVESGGLFELTGLATAISISVQGYGIVARRGGGNALLNEAAPAITAGIAKYAVGEAPTTSNSLPNVGDTLAPAANDDGSRITRVA